MKDKKQYLYLNAFLVKKEYSSLKTSEYIKSSSHVNTYDLDRKYDITGNLFVKIPNETKPHWSSFTEAITGVSLNEIENRSSSAVLIIKTSKAVIAFTFGYGRFLIDTKFFVQDFGIKTALNTLNHDSLRSVDLFTLEDQAVQKKSQASRESSVGVFGIDISRDVLRAVTGSPKDGVSLRNISGGDAVYSFGIEMDVDYLPKLVDLLSDYYTQDSYKINFSWVDNIRKIKEKSEIDILDLKLLDKIKLKSKEITITIPEIIQWDNIYGFSFTRNRSSIKPTIEPKAYLDNIDLNNISTDSLKRDKLFIHDIYDNEHEHKIYNCIYFEHKEKDKTYILFSGFWYEIDNSFVARINSTINQIEVSSLAFPKVHFWDEIEDGKTKSKIEPEGDYNERAAGIHSYHLLDKKLIKSNRSTTPIELCDLMTNSKQFIHVKHRKGGSAGLSHLFAQGSVSAEILLGDKDFRKKARTVLKKVCSGLQDTIPLDGFKSDGFEVVFLILGEDSKTLKENLPFFSKVNLSKAFENLSQRGFKVSIAGVEKELRPTT